MKKNLISFLASHPLASDFICSTEGKQFSDMKQYVADFYAYCKGKQINNFDNELWFKILQEKLSLSIAEDNADSYKIGEEESRCITFGQFLPYLKLNEYDLDDFVKEWQSGEVGLRKYTNEQSRRYKSYTETWLYDVHTCDDIFLEKYKYAAHPLIQSTIGKALINSGEHRGIEYLFNALTRAVVLPNIYWHNERAIIGYIEAIWEIIRLCKLAKINGGEEGLDEPQLLYKLLRLLFLYMSRYIELNSNDIKTADIYTNRAELFYFFPTVMKSLFFNYGFFAIISDLQVSSDKYMAFVTASRTCPELVSPFYEQCLWDAMKMYRYGSLTHFTIDGGYTEIEDASFMDIVKRCRIRSRIVAQKIFDEDSKGKVYLTKMQVQNLFRYVKSSEIDLHKNFKDLTRWRN